MNFLLLVRLVSTFAVVESSISRRAVVTTNRNEPRQLQIINKSGKKLVVDWVDPTTGRFTTIHSGVVDGESTVFDSFVNHTLAIHEPSEECSAQDGSGSCAIQYITVNDKSEQGKEAGHEF
jgi:hypothetical protein